MKIAVLDDYQGVAISMADWDALGPEYTVDTFERPLASEDEAARVLRDYDVLCLMRERMALTRELISQLPDLKLVVVTGSRFRCVDLEATAEHGVTVCASGGPGDAGPAELTMALILATARRIPQEDRNLREGGWQQHLGMLLEGSTLGILGLGRFGSKVARLGQAFGMRTIAWSPNLTPERAAEQDVEYADHDAFFCSADVVSIHIVLAPSTRGLVGARQFELMKASAILVNTSRGPIVDQDALIDALKTGAIAAAGIDVYEREPLPAGHPLVFLPNTVLTPHIGYVTERSYRVYFGQVVEVIKAWRSGKPIGVVIP